MNFFWKLIAWIVTRPRITQWLIDRATKTPYLHIRSADLTEVYMYRFWLFNPYLSQPEKDKYKKESKKLPWRFPISIRLHRIMVPDSDRHMHDHPFNARTIILRNWYKETRREYREPCTSLDWGTMLPETYVHVEYLRQRGDTATLKVGEYHHINEVPEDGVWTLFITGPRAPEDWGFLVDGQKVSFREYVRDGTLV